MKNFLSVLFISMLLLTACKKTDEVQPINSTHASVDNNLNLTATYASYRVIAGGSGLPGFQDGNGTKARFNSPYGICVNKDGSLLVSDYSNNAVRKLTSDTVVKTLNIPQTSNGTSLYDPADIAVLDDGTIGISHYEGLWFYKPTNNTLRHYLTNFHESITNIDKNPDGKYFWFTNNYKLGYTFGDDVREAKYSVTDTDDEPLNGVFACADGKKYVITNDHMYTVNANGNHTPIFTNLTFSGLMDIVVSKDGSKIYFIEKGDIKMIENCYRCVIKKTTLAIRTKASNIALANSGRYLYFTSGYYHTVNKLTL